MIAKPRPNDNAQSKRFLETAREIGARKDDSAADELMEKFMNLAPEPRQPKGDS